VTVPDPTHQLCKRAPADGARGLALGDQTAHDIDDVRARAGLIGEVDQRHGYLGHCQRGLRSAARHQHAGADQARRVEHVRVPRLRPVLKASIVLQTEAKIAI